MPVEAATHAYTDKYGGQRGRLENTLVLLELHRLRVRLAVDSVEEEPGGHDVNTSESVVFVRRCCRCKIIQGHQVQNGDRSERVRNVGRCG